MRSLLSLSVMTSLALLLPLAGGPLAGQEAPAELPPLVLEELGLRYLVTGSTATILYGEPRPEPSCPGGSLF